MTDRTKPQSAKPKKAEKLTENSVSITRLQTQLAEAKSRNVVVDLLQK